MSLCQKLVTDEEIFPTKYGEYLPVEGFQSPDVELLPPAASPSEVSVRGNEFGQTCCQ